MNNKESFREQQRKQLNIKITAVNNNSMTSVNNEGNNGEQPF